MSAEPRGGKGDPGSELPPSERLTLIARAVKGLFYERDAASGRMIRTLGREDSLSGIAASLEEWNSRVVEEDRERAVAAVRGAMERGEPYDVEYRLLHPDGRLLHVRDRGVVGRGGPSRPARVVGFLTDVTDQRLAEAKARAADELRARSEQRYRLLAENASDVIWTLDLRTRRFTYVSPSIERLRGITVAEAMAQPLETTLTPESRERAREALARIVALPEPVHNLGILDQPCKDGSVKHVEITATLIRDAAGAPVEVLGVSRDATERVRAEAALRESEELYRQLFALIPSGVVLLDERGRILAFNEQAHRQLGYTREAFAGLSIDDVDVRERGEAVPAHLRRIEAADGEDFEALHRTRDGELRNVLVSSRPVEVAGRRRFLAVWTDVTARREAERALQEQHANIDKIAEAALDGFASADATGAFVEVNENLCRMLGYSREELLAMRIPDLEVAETAEQVATRMAKIRAGSPERFETRYRARDGRILDVEVSVRHVDVDGGRYLAFLRDITERKRAELALRESEGRLSRIFQVAQAGIIVVRRSDGRIVDANDAWLRQMGWERAEAVGRTTVDLRIYVDPTQRDRFYEQFDSAGFVPLMEVRVRRRSGEEEDFLLTGGVGEVGGERCAVGIWHDVGALRSADERQRRSEARFRALIERSADLFSVLDAQGRATFVSPNMAEALGWTPQERMGRSVMEIIHPDDRPQAERVLREVLARPGHTARLAARARHKDGSWRRYDVVGRNLLDDPAVAGVVLNSRDVTEQHDLEERYRHAQKLEAVGRLAGGVAHDFNNLLTVVLSSVEGCQRDLESGRPVDPDDVTQIREAAERARDLTRQLLAFARKQVVAPVAMDLNGVVHGSEKLLRRVLGEEIRLEVRTAADLWTVLCDPGQVEQVLVNLAVNARDAMPRGGALTVETRNAHVEPGDLVHDAGKRTGDWVQLVIRDTGAGMAPEVMAHLFEPFFTTKEPGRGTGLGLATVHGIVTQSGGHVHVRSEPGQGSEFTVCLPRSRARVASAGVPAGAAAEAVEGSETVLLVEDDPQVRAVTARALERAGYRVLVATDGPAALALVAREGVRLDLVVTDVVMPGMTGPAVVEALRTRQPGLRALFVSGYTQDAVIQRGVLDTGFHFLAKPFTAAALRARVRAILDR